MCIKIISITKLQLFPKISCIFYNFFHFFTRIFTTFSNFLSLFYNFFQFE